MSLFRIPAPIASTFTAYLYKFWETIAGISQTDWDTINADKWWADRGFNLLQFPSTRIEFLITCELLYFSTVSLWTLFNYINFNPKNSQRKKHRDWVSYVFGVHNMLLSIFSGFIFFHTFPMIFKMFRTSTVRDIVCHAMPKAYAGEYGEYSHYFYLSKYYEFFDTYVVLIRGRVPMFLQPYHHMAAPLGMWQVLTTKSWSGFIFVVFNSFVHTIMYFYYAMSSLRISIPGKRYITLLQMWQFVIGMIAGLSVVIVYPDCQTVGDYVVVAYHEILSATFIVMFYRFYQRAYGKKKKKKDQ